MGSSSHSLKNQTISIRPCVVNLLSSLQSRFNDKCEGYYREQGKYFLACLVGWRLQFGSRLHAHGMDACPSCHLVRHHRWNDNCCPSHSWGIKEYFENELLSIISLIEGQKRSHGGGAGADTGQAVASRWSHSSWARSTRTHWCRRAEGSSMKSISLFSTSCSESACWNTLSVSIPNHQLMLKMIYVNHWCSYKLAHANGTLYTLYRLSRMIFDWFEKRNVSIRSVKWRQKYSPPPYHTGALPPT